MLILEGLLCPELIILLTATEQPCYERSRGKNISVSETFILGRHWKFAGFSVLSFPRTKTSVFFFKAETSESNGTSPGSSILFDEAPQAPPQGAVSLGVCHKHCPCWPVAAQLHSERSKQSSKPKEISFILMLALVPQHCVNIGVKPREQSWPECSQPTVWRVLGWTEWCSTEKWKNSLGNFIWNWVSEGSKMAEQEPHRDLLWQSS